MWLPGGLNAWELHDPGRGSPMTRPGPGTLLGTQPALGVVPEMLISCRVKSQLCGARGKIKSCFARRWARVLSTGSGMKEMFRARGRERDRRVDVFLYILFFFWVRVEI